MRVDHCLVDLEAASTWVEEEQSPSNLTLWQGTERKINIRVECDADGASLCWIESDTHDGTELFDNLPCRRTLGVLG